MSDVARSTVPARYVLVVEDDSFTRNLVQTHLDTAGFRTKACSSAAEAMREVEADEPHCLITDLDLGATVSGVDLLIRVALDRPWIGLVALTAHTSPLLVSRHPLPDSVVYLVKSQITDIDELTSAIEHAIADQGDGLATGPSAAKDDTRLVVSSEQAEVLRQIARGWSNARIAQHRGTTVRAVENLVQRTFRSLGLSKDGGRSPRIEAAALWSSGRVRVK